VPGRPLNADPLSKPHAIAFTVEHTRLRLEVICVQVEHIGFSLEHHSFTLEHIEITLEHIAFTLEHIGITLEHIAIMLEYNGFMLDAIFVMLEHKPNRIEHQARSQMHIYRFQSRKRDLHGLDEKKLIRINRFASWIDEARVPWWHWFDGMLEGDRLRPAPIIPRRRFRFDFAFARFNAEPVRFASGALRLDAEKARFDSEDSGIHAETLGFDAEQLRF
jgi:hypothetical protein